MCVCACDRGGGEISNDIYSMSICVCVCVYVCMYVYVCEEDKEICPLPRPKLKHGRVCVCVCVCARVCVCVPTWINCDPIKEVPEQGGLHTTEEAGEAFLLCEGEDTLDDGGLGCWWGGGGGGGRVFLCILLCLCLGLDDVEGHDEGVGAGAAHGAC